eukprot:gnl/TRDRNA2_/TRDRNA2_156260_c0_seq1.p1 gnl/TRDRNA2_/TRDRNA2_156260_c0~~gnl/TRDRNA2_/TRDRNA2_156260_c0_seq1.p1  ORF type:complete len:384 (-),score=48.17 gnl/TRDRNA2_/TRDRNA2_156260_c0_seq1:364-1377(-)
MTDELMQRNVSNSEANREAVRASLEVAVEVGFTRCGRLWVSCVACLALGMLGVLIWSEWIYDAHLDDDCDQPLPELLRFLYIIVALHVFQKEIIQYILCYKHSRDGPVEPARVLLFRRFCLLVLFGWPVAGAYMLSQTHKCTSELKTAVRVITIYYALVAIVVVIAPACFITLILCAVRHGLIRAPRSSAAAPDDLIEKLPVVEYDDKLFGDGIADGHPSECPICFEAFDAEKTISLTPCPGTNTNGHVFHQECLKGWLKCARTCPLCRTDLTETGPGGSTEANAASSSSSAAAAEPSGDTSAEGPLPVVAAHPLLSRSERAERAARSAEARILLTV